MKIPFILPGSGGGSGYHNYNEGLHDEDIDTESSEDFGSENAEHTFDEYMWMEHEEEFDQIEMERLEVEELTRQCMIECMGSSQDEDEEIADSELYNAWIIQYE